VVPNNFKKYQSHKRNNICTYTHVYISSGLTVITGGPLHKEIWDEKQQQNQLRPSTHFSTNKRLPNLRIQVIQLCWIGICWRSFRESKQCQEYGQNLNLHMLQIDLISQLLSWAPFSFGCSFVAFLLQPQILAFPWFEAPGWTVKFCLGFAGMGIS
jgi:hypothetical protein